jgi:type IX secretion system PorP/SprF family membrane protein
MMKFKLILFIFLNCGNLFAQDFITSQIYNVRLLQNPAFAGYDEGTNRIGLLHRAQFVTPGTFNINTFTIDKRFCKPIPKILGIGLGFYGNREEQGEGFLKTINVGFVLGLHKLLFKSHNLSIGLQFGAIQQSIDWSKLVFSDQINYQGIDLKISAASNSIPNVGSVVHDIGGGILYKYKKLKGYGPFILGASFFHISEQNIGLINDHILPIRTNFHIGKIWEKTSIDPLSNCTVTGRFMQQDIFKYQSYDINLNVTYDNWLIVGIGLRSDVIKNYSQNMHFILLNMGFSKVFFDKSYWQCLVNYDLNVSGVVGPFGIIELSIFGKINSKCSKSMKIGCPSF